MVCCCQCVTSCDIQLFLGGCPYLLKMQNPRYKPSKYGLPIPVDPRMIN